MLVYRESNNSDRIIVWPAIAASWLINGNDREIEFVRNYSMEILGHKLDEK